jgi:outer membrane immunogenic protein
MKTGLAIIGAASVAFAAPAFAQDSDLTGPWVAGVAGYDINKAGSSVDADIDDVDESVEGVMYGVALGYDYDMGNIVVGAEAELTDSNADTDYDDTPETFGLGAVDVGRDIYVGARLGYKVAPTTLVYAKAGYTNARYNYVGGNGTTDYSQHLDADGYRVGAGVEQGFGTNAFGRLEYRYSNYSEGELDFETPDVSDTDRFDIDTDRHQVVASVGWRF